jgi:hypothetical protein
MAFGVAAGLSLGAAIMLVIPRSEPVSARPGLVSRSGGETASIDAATGRVRAGRTGAEVRAMGLVDLELGPETAIAAVAVDRTLDIHLETGRIETSPLHEGVRLRVFADPYAIEGEGVLRLERRGPDIELAVVQGTVVVRGPGGSKRLESGERFSSKAPEPHAGIEPMEMEPAEPSRVRPPDRPKPRAVAERNGVRAAPPKPFLAPVEERPETPKAIEPPAAEVSLAPPVQKKVEAPQAIDLTPSIPEVVERVEPVETPESLYRRAVEERDAARAIALFDRVAASPSAWSEVSAHQAARLEMRRGRHAEAIARFTKLIGGKLGPEARLDIIECRLAMGDLEGAEREIGAFLSRHPENDRSPELRRLQAELEKKRARR